MTFKNDRYRRVRDGQTKQLQIQCAACGETICEYQKDGHGQLLRMYLDRISNSSVDITGVSLKCPQGHLIGVKIVYAKEDRPAFRLVPGSIKKSIV